MSTSMTLGELAVRFGLTLQGEPQARVSKVATLETADSDAISFLANPKYRRYLSTTRAGAVVLDAKAAAQCPVPALISKNPYATYARIAALLHPVAAIPAGTHPSASIDATAQIEPSASIGAQVVIGAHVRIDAGVVLGPGCVVMDHAHVGAHTRLVANVTLCERVVIGERCLFHPGVVIGADGFGLASDAGEWIKVPQLGSVRIGNDVEVGANSTIDRGAIEDTLIEDGVKLDNQIQIAHNVRIGAHTVVAGCSGVSGSTTIGRRCIIGGQVGIAGHLTICDDVVLTGRSFVANNLLKPGVYSGGLPVEEAGRFRKNAARFYQLDDFIRSFKRERTASRELNEPGTEDQAGTEDQE